MSRSLAHDFKRQQVLGMLRFAAAEGARCPTNDEIKDAVGGYLPYVCSVAKMAYEGLLRVEIYGRNWRVVEIEGLRTAPYPTQPDAKPYRIVDKHGDRRLRGDARDYVTGVPV